MVTWRATECSPKASVECRRLKKTTHEGEHTSPHLCGRGSALCGRKVLRWSGWATRRRSRSLWTNRRTTRSQSCRRTTRTLERKGSLKVSWTFKAGSPTTDALSVNWWWIVLRCETVGLPSGKAWTKVLPQHLLSSAQLLVAYRNMVMLF